MSTSHHIADFIERVRHPSGTPAVAEISALLTELNHLPANEADETTRLLLEGVRHRLVAMQFYLASNEEAALEELHDALVIFEQLQSTVDLARVALLAGNSHLALGHYPEALSAYEKAEILFDGLGETNGKARAIGNMGNVFNYTGKYQQALKQYESAAALHEEDGDLDGMARTIGGIGLVYANLSDYPMSFQHLQRALELYRSLSNKREEARVLGSLGNVFRQIGEYPRALEYFQLSRSIIEVIGEKAGLARVLMNLAGVYGDNKDFRRELDFSYQALRINEQTNDAATRARIYGSIASAQQSLGDFHSALENADISIESASTLHMHGLQCVLGIVRSAALFKLGRIDEALNESRECLTDANALGNISDGVKASMQIGDCLKAQGKLREAREAYMQTLDVARQLGESYTVSKILSTLADLLQDTDARTALEYYRESVKIDQQILGERQQRQIAVLDMERKMSEEHKLHEQHRGLLLQLMPDATVGRILSGEQIIADTYENASVMFLDIVGFTSLASQAPASHLVHLLNAVFEHCDTICDRHDLTKIKTIGDSYLATSGMPVLKDHHAHNIAAGALDLLKELQSLRVTIPAALGPADWAKNIADLEVRIGLHCGPVVAGVIGKKRAQYDVWGDTVNVASRMESTSQPGKIQVSDAFATMLARDAQPMLDGADVVIRSAPFLLRLRGTIDVKGKGEMKTWWLERSSAP
ncbi:MAG: tetratricopeptide repeat protein [Candidatus Kapabacteria bacterium]|nr:tetratricopeptide repeat protein [Candidatus Kapabacteria bacterium]